jgi:hypothetical protein
MHNQMSWWTAIAISLVLLAGAPSVLASPAYEGSTIDPAGDSSSGPDITLATIVIDDAGFHVRIEFATGTLDPLTTKTTFSIDADQNPSTGSSWHGIGVDAMFEQGYLGDTQTVYLWITGSGHVATSPVTFGANSIQYDFQRNLLPDDGLIDYIAAVQTALSGSSSTIILDYAPSSSESDSTAAIPESGAASFGSVTDPSGDASTGIYDFVSGSALVSGGNLILTVNFAPGTFDWHNVLVGANLDTDQNPHTGWPGIDSNHNDSSIFGSDYFVSWGGSTLYGYYQLVKYNGAGGWTKVASGFATTNSPNCTSVTIPLSLLGNDNGLLNFDFVVSKILSVNTSTALLDYMPNKGSYGSTTAVPAPTTLYFPQIADGGGYMSTFTIFNPTSRSATGVLTLWDGNGQAWDIAMVDGSTSSQFVVNLPSYGSVRLVTSGAGGIKAGWAVLESAADLQGVATFDYRPDSMLLDSIGVVGSSASNSFLMPIDISPSANEGLAIVNPGTADVSIHLTLKNEDGSTYLSLADPRLTPLEAKKNLSLYATELFPALQSGSFKGLLAVEVTGSGRIAVMGLSYKEGQISVIPVLAPQ